jgi:hypothetical protein
MLVECNWSTDLADKATTANMMTGGHLFMTMSAMKAGLWNKVWSWSWT